MAKGDRKGLPTKKKVVSRVTKSGKMSIYSQSYHLNPFKKSGNKNKSPKQEGDAGNKADLIVEKMRTRPAIDKRATVEGMLTSVDPKRSIGYLKTDKICSKLKSIQDVEILSKNLLQNSLSGLKYTDSVHDINKVNEHTKIFNNIPETPEAYSVVLKDLINNRSKMANHVFSSLIYSLKNHPLIEKVLSGKMKSESYDKDDLLHDWKVQYSNPVSQIINYYNGDLSDNYRATATNLQQKDNDLTYLNNGVVLTDQEREMNQRQIDFNNEGADKKVSAGLLHNNVFIKLDKEFASMVYNANSEVNFSLYNSIIYEFKNGTENLSEDKQSKIKDVKVNNESNFTLHSSSFYLYKPTKEIFLIFNVSIKNTGDYNFASLAKNDTSQFIDNYNGYVMDSVNTSKLSKTETRKKLDDLDSRYKVIDNQNSYLLIER